MPRQFRGGLRNVLAAGGQRAVSRFIALGSGPAEIHDFVASRFPDLIEDERINLISHANDMGIASQLLEEGLLGNDDADVDIPINPRLASEEGIDGAKYSYQVIIDVIDIDSGELAFSQFFTFHHSELMSAYDLEGYALDAWDDMVSAYDGFNQPAQWIATVGNILSVERAY